MKVNMTGEPNLKPWPRVIFTLVVACAIPIPTALGNGVQPKSVTSENEIEVVKADMGRGYQAIDAGEYETAIEFFQAALVADPKNAEAFRQLGYVNRRLQNFDQAFAFYAKALEIAPDHTGAHNYVGEAYLEVGDLARAEHHLRQLDLLCLFGCEDYYELEQAVALYIANNGS
jgi:tetratricopeptide (TPR) repeat protein